MEGLHVSTMLVVMHAKGMQVCSLMGNWFVFKTDRIDCQFVGVYCEMDEAHSTLARTVESENDSG